MSVVLEVSRVSKRFGGVKALDGCNLTLREGECLGLIGPNGSGKTTLLNVVNGFHKPDSGSIVFKGRRIEGLPPNKICRMGVGRVFQVTRLFNGMSVIENITVESVWNGMGEREAVERALELMREFGLPEDLSRKPAKGLSGGQQKLVDLARALMSDPELLLLDEPLAGVHPLIKDRIIRVVKSLVEDGKTVLLVSHDIASVSKLADEVAFMSSGKIIARDRLDRITSYKEVIESYLGGG